MKAVVTAKWDTLETLIEEPLIMHPKGYNVPLQGVTLRRAQMEWLLQASCAMGGTYTPTYPGQATATSTPSFRKQ